MVTTMSNPSSNGTQSPPATPGTVSAIIFYAYIVLALVYTFLIVSEIYTAYNASQNASPASNSLSSPSLSINAATDRSKPIASSSGSSRRRDGNVLVLSLLTILSFTTLSYQMLAFLIQSYQTYSSSTLLPSNLSIGSVWTWSTHRRLFTDFANELCTNSNSFWWSKAGLMWSMGVSVFMAVEGVLFLPVLPLLAKNHAI